MSFLVVIVIDNPDDFPLIIEAWQALGVSGATIFESSGMGRMKKRGLQDDFPLIPSLAAFLEVRDEPHHTIFSVVENESMVDAMSEAARKIIGNLDHPHTGFLFVVPVIKAFGLGRGK